MSGSRGAGEPAFEEFDLPFRTRSEMEYIWIGLIVIAAGALIWLLIIFGWASSPGEQ